MLLAIICWPMFLATILTPGLYIEQQPVPVVLPQADLIANDLLSAPAAMCCSACPRHNAGPDADHFTPPTYYSLPVQRQQSLIFCTAPAAAPATAGQGICYKRAVEAGIATAKLPIAQHVKLQSSAVRAAPCQGSSTSRPRPPPLVRTAMQCIYVWQCNVYMYTYTCG